MRYHVAGHVPAVQRLVLLHGQDFAHLYVPVTPFPDGTTVMLAVASAFPGTVYGIWPVSETADGWLATIDAVDHSVIPDGARYRLYATYPGLGRYCWIAGPIERSRR